MEPAMFRPSLMMGDFFWRGYAVFCGDRDLAAVVFRNSPRQLSASP